MLKLRSRSRLTLSSAVTLSSSSPRAARRVGVFPSLSTRTQHASMRVTSEMRSNSFEQLADNFHSLVIKKYIVADRVSSMEPHALCVLAHEKFIVSYFGMACTLTFLCRYGGHTGGAYDTMPEVCLLDAFFRAQPNKFVPVLFDEAGHRVATQYCTSCLQEMLAERIPCSILAPCLKKIFSCCAHIVSLFHTVVRNIMV